MSRFSRQHLVPSRCLRPPNLQLSKGSAGMQSVPLEAVFFWYRDLAVHTGVCDATIPQPSASLDLYWIEISAVSGLEQVMVGGLASRFNSFFLTFSLWQSP